MWRNIVRPTLDFQKVRGKYLFIRSLRPRPGREVTDHFVVSMNTCKHTSAEAPSHDMMTSQDEKYLQ